MICSHYCPFHSHFVFFTLTTYLLFPTDPSPPTNAFHFILLRCIGPVYKLAFGPRSFIVVSDPVMAKHVLKSSVGDYDKGVLATVSSVSLCVF